MTHGSGGVELSQRDCEILKDVVATYVSSGEPVSSRRVAKHEVHELSSASIRNVMADLEELGYLRQPHTSAGRVPTPQGYHLFIDSLMTVEAPSESDRKLIDQELAGEAGSLAETASQLLSRLSCLVGIGISPDIGSAVLRTIEFVPLEGMKVLCVTVAVAGSIDHKVIEMDEPLSREQLIEASNYLNENFSMMTMREIRDQLVERMEHARAEVDLLLRRVISLADKGLVTTPGDDLVVEGTESLLNQPELADLSRIRKLFETFNDKARVVRLLNYSMAGEGVRVLIGEESDLTSELDCSLIFKAYRVDEQTLGGLGLFGPSRMEYPRLIPLVDYLGDRLSRVLSATMNRDLA